MIKARLLQFTDIFFLLLITVLLVSAFYYMSNDEGQKQQQEIVERAVHHSFISVLARAKSDAILIYEMQYANKFVLSLLDQANQEQQSFEELNSIKQRLSEHMSGQFQASRKLFSHQQLYLKNGRSLLHLDAPSASLLASRVDNASLNKVIETHEAFFGLVLQDGRYQYSYLFPIFNEQNYFVGVVELSMPLMAMQRGLKQSYNSRSEFLFLKHLVASVPYKSSLYEDSGFDDLFYVSRSVISEMDKQNTLELSDLLELRLGLSNAEHTQLLQLKRTSFLTSLDGQEGTGIFIPLYNVQGDEVGGLLSFVPHVHLSLTETDLSIVDVLLALLAFVTLFYIFKKSACMFYMQVMYQRFIDAVPFPIFLKYDGSQYLRANRSFYHFFNIPKKKLLDKKLGFDSEPEMLRVSLREINEAGGYIEQEHEEYRDGQPYTYKIHYFSTKPRRYFSQGIIGYVQDITEKKHLNACLEASIFDQNQFMDLLPLGVRVFNLAGDITYLNKSFEKLSGYSKDDFLDQDCTSLFSCLQCDLSRCPLKNLDEFNKPWSVETIKYNKRHEAGTYQIDYQPYYSVDKKLQGIIEITRDITKDKSLLDKNHELMLTDELTGLFNSRGLYSAGENHFRLAVRANKAFFVLYVDIYGLRKINKEFGDKEGDYLLKTFAHILVETFRETDIVARIGGDEFVILMNDSDYRIEDNSCFVRLERNVNKFNEVNDKPYSLIIDTGIVQYHQQKHQNLQALVNEGEQLVYEHRFNRTLK